MKCFDHELPDIRIFTCTCPHCGYERMAIDNGKLIQARFTQSACDDTIITCTKCGRSFERLKGMRPIGVPKPLGSLLELAV